MKKLTETELVLQILEDIHKDMSDEEIIHILLERSFASKQSTKDTFLTKLSDHLARFGGSWSFLCIFLILLIGWIFINRTDTAFDPYPYILLNLLLSCVSSLQAPIIMMSQNRQSLKDKDLLNNQYKVTLKNEIILQDLHVKLDELLKEKE